MSVDSRVSSRHDRPATGARRPGMVRAMGLVLGLLVVAVFAQAVLAGLFLDGGDAWRGWHAANGMLVLPLLALVQVGLAVLMWRRGHGPGWLPITSVVLLLTLVIQSALGMTSQVAVHVPLGVAIFGLTGALLVRTRALTRPATRGQDGGWPRPAPSAPADHQRPLEGTP